MCLSIWFFCKACRVDDALMGDDGWGNENLDLEISRIEANVNAFSQIEKNRKKIKLLRAFKKHTETVTKEQEQDAATEEEHPVVVDEDKKSENDFESQLSTGCRICLDEYEENDKVILSSNPSCKHMFHQQCILEWLSSRDAPECPCCRQCFMDSLERSLAVGSNNDDQTSRTSSVSSGEEQGP